MGRQLYICNSAGSAMVCTIGAEDGSMLETSVGRKRADALVPTAQAEVTLPGVDVNGDVLVKSFFGGDPANQIQVAFATGPTGAGNESLALRIDLQGSAPVWEVNVLFATDGGGASVTPSATDVANLLNTDPAVASVVEATLPGTGASDVVASALTALAGGTDTGDWLRFDSKVSVCRQIHRIETV